MYNYHFSENTMFKVLTSKINECQNIKQEINKNYTNSGMWKGLGQYT